MHNDKPFIHLLNTRMGYYIFDVNTNSIIRTVENVYQYLKDEQDNKTAGMIYDNEIMSSIEDLKSKGFLSSNRPKVFIHPDDDYVDYKLGNKLRRIVIQITQCCNFRCSYCIYSEDDNTAQRSHSLKSMTFETAKKSIDFLIDHSKDFSDINIGFYGGEPLLEFNLLKKCVEYAQMVSEGKNISFTTTTNGSLLTLEKIEFLLKNNIPVMISLDGPMHIQDKHRRFAVDGSGTFETVMKNLDMIREKYPEYLKKISFNAVVDTEDDINCVNDFFISYDLFKKSGVSGTTIDDVYSNQKITFPEQYITKSNYEYFKVLLNNIGLLPAEYISPLARARFDNVKRLVDELGGISRLPEKMSRSGPCTPGVHKLFINVDGEFYPCERVSEISSVMNIGNLDTGYDVEKIRNLMNISRLTADKCQNCWALKHCTLCAKYADNIKDLSAGMINTQCHLVKYDVENRLLDHITMNEIERLYRSSID